MTYYDSAEGVTITAERAWKEFDKQQLGRDSEEAADFTTYIAGRNELDAQDVLGWLGF